MAIQPIDLQTLFTQIDKVAKTQSAQREGLAMQQTMQGEQIQRKTEELINSVNQAQNTGEDGAEKVKDQGKKNMDNSEKKKKDPRQEENTQEEEAKAYTFRDPFLGRNIDISL